MSNPKNSLQEHQQRYQLDLPSYSSTQTERGWISQVQVNGKTYTGQPCPKKTKADCSAAAAALLDLTGSDGSSAVSTSSSPPVTYSVGQLALSLDQVSPLVYVLVDYENTNKIEKLEHFVHTKDQLTLLKFTSHLHSQADKANIVVESAIKDAVDHYISFYAGMLCQHIKSSASPSPVSIIVLTRDHFASAMINFTDQSKVNIYHCPSEDRCLQLLEQLNISLG